MSTQTRHHLVQPLRDDAAPELVGTKAAVLSRLATAGFAVPESLVLTTAAHELYRHSPALPAAVEDALAMIAEHFGDATLAVRSSACAEDRSDASFAGQYESVLGVRGVDALRAAVLHCWNSASSERVMHYREGGQAGMAVLVQRQLHPDIAGVAFTADPITGATDAVLVSAAPGLGDVVTAGAITPDEWTVSGRTATAARVTHGALTAEQAVAIAGVAVRVATVLGSPQDIEWAMGGGRLILLQSRPITALPRPQVVDLPPGSWFKETERYAEPMTALGASEAVRFVSAGLTAMFAEYGGLIETVQCRSIGGEIYLCMVPFGDRPGRNAPPWWLLGILARLTPALRARMRAASRTTRPADLADMAERWRRQWRPAFIARIATLRTALQDVGDDSELARHIGEIRRLFSDTMAVHFRMTPVAVVPLYRLNRLLGSTHMQVVDLVAGASSVTSEPARMLAPIASAVQANPALLAALADDVDPVEALRAESEALAASFEAWCSDYAECCVSDDPGSPTVAEQPHMLARLLTDSATDIDAQLERAGRVRAAAQERARRTIAGEAPDDRRRFEAALADALAGYGLREDVARVTGSLPGGLVRRAALEAGRRLASAGRIARQDDVLNLDIETLCTALVDTDLELREQIETARAHREWARLHPGPALLGDPPSAQPDLRGLPRPARELNEAMLWAREKGERTAGSTTGVGTERGTVAAVRGMPGSPGRHTGIVRVITDAADFPKLRHGDVLVARTTDPAWSVLFGIAGALVTDTGGLLSHAAIVAREHGIPAVLATESASRTLHDGQRVTVDGSAGVVDVESDPVTHTRTNKEE